jgi:hypothetical protein
MDLHLAVTALGRPHRRTRTRTRADPLTDTAGWAQLEVVDEFESELERLDESLFLPGTTATPHFRRYSISVARWLAPKRAWPRRSCTTQ